MPAPSPQTAHRRPTEWSNSLTSQIDPNAQPGEQATQDAIQQEISHLQHPTVGRSLWQLANTLVPYLALMALSFWAMEYSFWLALPSIVLASGFLIRLFIIFHDCGHGAFFASDRLNVIVGNFTGILTFTPYDYWHKSHAKHHATSGNLDKRGFGDVWMMTVKEYMEAPWKVRLQYRLYRNPGVMFLLGPLFIVLITHRVVRRKATTRERRSVYITNAAVLLMSIGVSLIVGWKIYLVTQFLVLYIGTMAGIWLFYVQHQFEGVYWARQPEWDFVAASLDGGSFYALPKVLNWFTGNIGYHHVHHLNSRIPNYNLPKCHKKHELLAATPKIKLLPSLKSLTYRLWDEQENRLVGFGQVKNRIAGTQS
jgi:omega-6 fatty acid desaturase (delta-12 desaturase)